MCSTMWTPAHRVLNSSFAGWLCSSHVIRWLHVRPPVKDPVQAMLPICLQKQMEGNQLISKATWTFVARMGIWPDSADRGE